MGSPPDEVGRSHDETPFEATLSRSFYMHKTEITNHQVATVLNWALGENLIDFYENGNIFNTEGVQQGIIAMVTVDWCQISFDGDNFIVEPGSGNHPAIGVTWYGALAICNFMSDMEGLERAIDFDTWEINPDANGYRLPFEAEWEYACRAGTTTAFHTGPVLQEGFDPMDSNLDKAGWYWGNTNNSAFPRESGGQGTMPVGLKAPNNWDLYDMHGNVHEMVLDSYSTYPDGAVVDPFVRNNGISYVIRGGSWYNWAEYCRSGTRYNRENHHNSGSYSIGFRPVRTAD